MPIFENGQIGTRDFTLIQSHVNNVDGYILGTEELAKIDFNNDSTITTNTVNNIINNTIVSPEVELFSSWTYFPKNYKQRYRTG